MSLRLLSLKQKSVEATYHRSFHMRSSNVPEPKVELYTGLINKGIIHKAYT